MCKRVQRVYKLWGHNVHRRITLVIFARALVISIIIILIIHIIMIFMINTIIIVSIITIGVINITI